MSIHFVEYPCDGPTLLLLHGLTRCGRDWGTLVSGLSGR
ncbi:alpha/beta fold hydrolase [Roseiconus lacunae]